MAIAGVTPEKGSSGSFPHTPQVAEAEQRLAHGELLFEGSWFKPIFTPPSKHKALDLHPYIRRIRAQLHSRLPTTQRILVAGYSFPDADRDHLKRLFVREIMPPDLEVQVVDPASHSASFRSRVSSVFGANSRSIDYSVGDFRAFCMGLPAPIGLADS